MQLDIELYQMLGFLLVCVGVFLWTQRNNKKTEEEVKPVGGMNKDHIPDGSQTWVVIYRKFVPKYYGLAGSHVIYCAKHMISDIKPRPEHYEQIMAKETTHRGGKSITVVEYHDMKDLGYVVHQGPMSVEEFESRWETLNGAGLVFDNDINIDRYTRKRYQRVERRRPVL